MEPIVVTKDGITRTELPQMKITWNNPIPIEKRVKASNQEEMYEMLKLLYDDQMEFREISWEILLNDAGEVIGVYELSKGGQSNTSSDPKLVFQAALTARAAAIVLAHNHPNGDLNGKVKPSDADKRITWQLVDLGNKMQLPILDHMIVSPNGYFSFAKEGILNGPKGQNDLMRMLRQHITGM